MKKLPTLQDWTIDTDLNRDWEANYDLFASQIDWCCDQAGRSGLKVLIEPHPYRMVSSAIGMRYLLDRVKRDNLGFNFDSSHLFPGGDMPQCAIYQLRGKIWHTHLSDNDSFTNAHWRPGKGKINWNAVMKALRDIDYNGALSFELEDVPGASHPNVIGNDSIGDDLHLAMEYIREVAQDAGLTIE